MVSDGFRCGRDPSHDPKTGDPRNDNDNDQHDPRGPNGAAAVSQEPEDDARAQAAGVSVHDHGRARANKATSVTEVITRAAVHLFADYIGTSPRSI